MFKARHDLERLCRLLESGDSVPAELAGTTAKLVREAIANDGKLPLGRKKKVGRPKAGSEPLGRACHVAKLIIVDKKTRSEAIVFVAGESNRKPSTIEKDYKRYGKYAREIVRRRARWPEWIRSHEELKQLLLTFRDDDGLSPTIEEVEMLTDSLPCEELKVYIDRVNNRPLRRDYEFLEKVFAPVQNDGT